MKRLIALLLLALTLAACYTRTGPATLLNRELLLPVGWVSGLTGTPMRLACDKREEDAGYIRWAWEETEGLTKLLVVEFQFTPADAGRLYEQAVAGAEPKPAQPGVSACCDARALHLLIGSYYIKVSMLGIEDDEKAQKQITTLLTEALSTKE